MIHDFDFTLGDLVLVWNTATEKALNSKMRCWYLDSLIVISRNQGGAYIIVELDGSVFHRPIVAFQVIPYFTQSHISLPLLHELLDISQCWLQGLENSEAADLDNEDGEENDLFADDWGQSFPK